MTIVFPSGEYIAVLARPFPQRANSSIRATFSGAITSSGSGTGVPANTEGSEGITLDVGLLGIEVGVLVAVRATKGVGERDGVEDGREATVADSVAIGGMGVTGNAEGVIRESQAAKIAAQINTHPKIEETLTNISPS